MNRILEKKSKGIPGVIALFIVILICATQLAAIAAGNSVILTVDQVYSASFYSTEETFSYILIPLAPDNPMPTGSTLEGYSFTITGNRSAAVGPMSYGQAGIYRYQIYQVIRRDRPGLYYDRRTYTVEVHVDDSLNAVLVAKDENDFKVGKIEFANQREYYPPVYPPPPPYVWPEVEWPEEEWPEEEEPVDSGPILEEFPPPPVDDIDDIDYDNINFGHIPGGDLDLIDEEVPTVTAEVSTPPAETEPAEKNIPNAGGGSPRSGSSGPKTGDESNTALAMILFGAGGLMASGAALVLINSGKRKGSGD